MIGAVGLPIITFGFLDSTDSQPLNWHLATVFANSFEVTVNVGEVWPFDHTIEPTEHEP